MNGRERKTDQKSGSLFIWGEENMIKIYLKLNIVLHNKKYNKKNPQKKKNPIPKRNKTLSFKKVGYQRDAPFSSLPSLFL